MSDWKPIETAPKDTAILVAYQSREIELIGADDNDYDWQPCPPGQKQGGIDRPTHWMPLPNPPT